jgi:subtilisin family serine protease
MRYSCQGIIFSAALLAAALLLSRTADAVEGKSSGEAYWIEFKDKGKEDPISLSERALERRARGAAATVETWYDIRVSEDYLEALREFGLRIRNVSRWLNAASVDIDAEKIEEVASLPFVSSVTRVSSYSRNRPQPVDETPYRQLRLAAFNYGPSYAQNNLIAVDSLHNLDLSGSGVLIGIMDTGFDTSHVVFDSMRVNGRVLGTYDFINDDSNVVDGPDFQRSHGTQVLSVLAGFSEGSLIGPAYGSDFLLAKTEIVSSEIEAEEDNWIAAAEWMEPLGVDIISSSLGYIDWYDTTQLDGRTAAITQAANIAVSLGVVVVNAAGNEGNTSWRKVIPPADGDSVIAVGAVYSTGEIVGFSSRGPTVDGRIKPDFCAMGATVYVANWAGGYGYSAGTSFATPLVAGGIALLLEGHPGWTVADILEVVKRASSNSHLPNNTYGWGIPDFAVAFYGGSGSPSPRAPSILIAPQPAIDSVLFYLNMHGRESGDLSIHDPSGSPVNIFKIMSNGGEIVRFVWDGRNRAGRKVASGIYICVLSSGSSESIEKFFLVSNQ